RAAVVDAALVSPSPSPLARRRFVECGGRDRAAVVDAALDHLPDPDPGPDPGGAKKAWVPAPPIYNETAISPPPARPGR
ncbi:MAG TPA: hypothetical protein PK847_15705, partial [Candidatus Sumerlaeota bacterium]|nr:hypothetical protein [Candidatus Sumerlaeota bacterium]